MSVSGSIEIPSHYPQFSPSSPTETRDPESILSPNSTINSPSSQGSVEPSLSPKESVQSEQEKDNQKTQAVAATILSIKESRIRVKEDFHYLMIEPEPLYCQINCSNYCREHADTFLGIGVAAGATFMLALIIDAMVSSISGGNSLFRPH